MNLLRRIRNFIMWPFNTGPDLLPALPDFVAPKPKPKTFPEEVIERYRDRIHLEPYTVMERNPGYLPLRYVEMYEEAGIQVDDRLYVPCTRWRALPCRGFVPKTHTEYVRCPSDQGSALGAYKARLRELMRADSYGEHVIHEVMTYVDTARERKALQHNQQEAERRKVMAVWVARMQGPSFDEVERHQLAQLAQLSTAANAWASDLGSQQKRK